MTLLKIIFLTALLDHCIWKQSIFGLCSQNTLGFSHRISRPFAFLSVFPNTSLYHDGECLWGKDCLNPLKVYLVDTLELFGKNVS